MKLTEFIRSHHEKIIEDWVSFARTMVPWSDGLSEENLRDHAEELLTAVVIDMQSPQSADEQEEKSKGNALDGQLGRIGQRHASDRLESGLGLDQLVSEFRALRASVLRLWEVEQSGGDTEVTRFNEAIDETLAKSASRYTRSVEKTRDQFLGILGHDLRNPLGAILMGASLLADSEDAEVVEVSGLIRNSAERMNRMVNDLLDLTRTRLGSGIPIMRQLMDIKPVCSNVLSELKALHPKTDFHFEPQGDLSGEWDSDRLAQVISNLLSNAVQYSSDNSPISVSAESAGDSVVIQVHNFGTPIAAKVLKSIFAPMVRTQPDGQSFDKNKTGLGLGLYIASEIVNSHHGSITVTSKEADGTTFTVSLPRHPRTYAQSTMKDSQSAVDIVSQTRRSRGAEPLLHS